MWTCACNHMRNCKKGAQSVLQGNLKYYNNFDNVWQFEVRDATFKLTPKAQGSLANAPQLKADKLKMICVDARLCQATE